MRLTRSIVPLFLLASGGARADLLNSWAKIDHNAWYKIEVDHQLDTGGPPEIKSPWLGKGGESGVGALIKVVPTREEDNVDEKSWQIFPVGNGSYIFRTMNGGPDVVMSVSEEGGAATMEDFSRGEPTGKWENTDMNILWNLGEGEESTTPYSFYSPRLSDAEAEEKSYRQLRLTVDEEEEVVKLSSDWIGDDNARFVLAPIGPINDDAFSSFAGVTISATNTIASANIATATNSGSSSATDSASNNSDDDSTPDSEASPSKGLSAGAAAGIGVACTAIVILAVVAAFFFWRRRRRNNAAPAPQIGGKSDISDSKDAHLPEVAPAPPPNYGQVAVPAPYGGPNDLSQQQHPQQQQPYAISTPTSAATGTTLQFDGSHQWQQPVGSAAYQYDPQHQQQQQQQQWAGQQQQQHQQPPMTEMPANRQAGVEMPTHATPAPAEMATARATPLPAPKPIHPPPQP